jgi:hypothetical protein
MVEKLLILGLGPSMAAVWNGSLVNKEAGWKPGNFAILAKLLKLNRN